MNTVKQHGNTSPASIALGVAVTASVIGVGTWAYLNGREDASEGNVDNLHVQEDQKNNPVAVAAALYNSVLSDDFSNVESLTARLKAIKVSELEEQLHKKKQKPDIDDFDLQEINAIEAELSKLSKKNESEILEIDISPYLSKGALDNIRGRIKTISEQLNAHSIPETYKYYLDVAQNIFTFYKPNTIEEQELMRSIKAYRAFSRNAYYTIEDIRSLYGPVDSLKVCRYLIGADDYSRISPYEMKNFVSREINILIKKLPASITDNHQIYTNDDFTELNASTLQDLVNLNHVLPSVISIPALIKPSPDEDPKAGEREYQAITENYDKAVRKAVLFTNHAVNFYECQINTTESFSVNAVIEKVMPTDNLVIDKIPLDVFEITLQDPVPGCTSDKLYVAAPKLNDYRNIMKNGMPRMSEADVALYSNDIKLLETINSRSRTPVKLELLGSELAAVESKLKQYPERGFYRSANATGKLVNLSLPSYALLNTLDIRRNADLIFISSPLLAAKQRQAQEKLKIVNSFKTVEESMILLDFESLLNTPYEYLATREESINKQLENLSSVTPNLQLVSATPSSSIDAVDFTIESSEADDLIAIASNEEDTIELATNTEEIKEQEEAANEAARLAEEARREAEEAERAQELAHAEAEAAAKAAAEAAAKEAEAAAREEAERAEELAKIEAAKAEAAAEAARIEAAKAEELARAEAAKAEAAAEAARQEAIAKAEAAAKMEAELAAAEKAEAEKIAAEAQQATEEIEMLTKEQLAKADFKTLKAQSDAGNPIAQYELASRYISGKKGVRRDLKNGNALLAKAAEAGYPEAKYMLGSIYLQGKYTKQQKQQGANYIIEVAEDGLQDAMYAAGNLYLDGTLVPQNYQKAAQFLSLAAEKNNTDAQYKLGIMYLNGKGVQTDQRKAASLLTSASKKNGSAAYELAKLYEDPNTPNITSEEQTIKDLYVFAARHNVKEANRKAGLALIGNLSTSKEALKYLNDYINKGDQEVDDALLKYYIKTNNTREISKHILHAPKDIQEMYPVEMGILYASGNGVNRNIDKAEEFYRIGMAKNIPDAFCHAGDLYSTDASGKRNIPKAVELYTQGMNLGSAKCIESLVRTKLADNKTRDYKEIFALLNRVPADKLSDGSKVILASFYQYGRGIEKNPAHAARILKTITSPKAKLARDILLGQKVETCGHSVLMGETGKRTHNTTLLSAAALMNLFYYAEVRAFGVVNYNDVYTKAKRICGNTPGRYILHDADSKLKKPTNPNPTDAKAQYYLAMNYFYDGDYQKAFEWMHKSASQKYFKAYNNLGIFYLMGIGTNVNAEEAFRNLNFADSAGDYKATFNFAALQMNGIGGPKNPTKALGNIKSAALKGNEMATYYISSLYAQGRADGNIDDAIRILSNILY